MDTNHIFWKEYKKQMKKYDDLHDRLRWLKEDNYDLIENHKEYIKTIWPKLGKYYRVINPKENIPCICHYGWKPKTSAKCRCKANILYFKNNTPFTLKKFKNLYFKNDGHIESIKISGHLYDEDFLQIDFDFNEINIEFLEEIPVEKTIKIEKKSVFNKVTFIYLMIDHNTSLYKIGRSDNPKIRESTLQSEKPTIEMLFNFKAMSSIEKELHNKYNYKRVRGEWFKLDYSDIRFIEENYLEKYSNEAFTGID